MTFFSKMATTNTFRQYDLFVAPEGNDSWNGTLPNPNSTRTNGPLATIKTAKRLVFEQLRRGWAEGRVTVWIRDGIYNINTPLTFDHMEAGEVTFAAYPGETPIFDGGFRIRNWKESHRADNLRLWCADLRDFLLCYPTFRSFWVNGQRRQRPRWPKKGQVPIERIIADRKGSFDGNRHFILGDDDFPAHRNLQNVDAIIRHLWTENRMPLERYEAEARLVTCGQNSMFKLDTGASLFFENVFEAMDAPGEWYLDEEKAQLLYLPFEGETFDNTECVVPLLNQFLRIEGDVEREKYVNGLHFDGLCFRYADWVHPEGWSRWFDPCKPATHWREKDSSRHFTHNDGGLSSETKATTPQGATNVPGVLHFEGVHDCTVRNCTIEHIGFYAIEVREGCRNLRFQHNIGRDLGAGGIKMDGGGIESAISRRTGFIRVIDNSFVSGGRVFAGAMGIMAMFANDCDISFNHICDFYQSAISVGWKWDYEKQVGGNHRIEGNRISTIGQGILSDMGAIYTLGVLSGTVIRGNYISDIRAADYGAIGIYLDQGSSGILVENNVIFRAGDGVVIHWGRSNTFRNNLLAFCDSTVVLCHEPNSKWVEFPFPGLTMERNVFVVEGRPVYIDCERFLEFEPFICDFNFYCDLRGPATIYRFTPGYGGELQAEWTTEFGAAHPDARLYSMADWQLKDHDLHSYEGNLGIIDPKNSDFLLQDDSPLHILKSSWPKFEDSGPRKASSTSECIMA